PILTMSLMVLFLSLSPFLCDDGLRYNLNLTIWFINKKEQHSAALFLRVRFSYSMLNQRTNLD
ncbi:hypothetical protein OFC49_40900, partial [Escherichia coli]|nr:hypothetical protein [Escherichia coli]